ncbi:bifunctional D-altronate/D-mannonate dehydratase, partial [bacterium F16]
MKITHVDVFVCSPSRNFVTLKITTDEGVFGIGDATLNGRELGVAAILKEHIGPALIGKDPANIEDIWHYLYRGVYWKRGPIGMTALAAVDMALWDIKGKVLQTPLYNLLGGKSRTKMLVYAHANGADLGGALESVAAMVEQGYRAIRVQSGVPGIPDAYGVDKSGKGYEPAGKGVAKEYAWDTEKYLRFTPKLFATVREQFGDDLLFLHDAH